MAMPRVVFLETCSIQLLLNSENRSSLQQATTIMQLRREGVSSNFQWKGLHPQRFSGGKKHLTAEEELGPALTSMLVPSSYGIRTYEPLRSGDHEFKPCLKVFPQHHGRVPPEIDLRGKKYLELSEQAERIRKQKGHVPGGQKTTQEIQMRGLRSFVEANKSRQHEYSLEAKMKRKVRIDQLDKQRNQLGVATLGDKPYKYPQYSPNFYHPGGLIAGSTAFPRPGQPSAPSSVKTGSLFTKPMWTQKVKMEETAEERNVVNSVDEWEQTILKEANPGWNDPQTFFQRLQKQKGGDKGKDVKKGGKK